MLCCWSRVISAIAWPAIVSASVIAFAVFVVRLIVQVFCRNNARKRVIGIFHPYCNAGGGGERVLWCIVKYLQEKWPQYEVVIYTGDTDVTSEQIMIKMRNNFKIDIKRSPTFVFLTTRPVLEARHYPLFTLAAQSVASIVVGFEALFKCVPDIYVDTMGYSFTYFAFKWLAGCRVACYTHYPIISTDMIATVTSAADTFNNRAFIAKSRLLTTLKLFYYRAFAAFYGFAGRRSDCVMVNSSWTKGHIDQLWSIPQRTFLVYPPCNTGKFEALPATRPDTCKYQIVSVAQFRPEKNQQLQLQAMQLLLRK